MKYACYCVGVFKKSVDGRGTLIIVIAGWYVKDAWKTVLGKCVHSFRLATTDGPWRVLLESCLPICWGQWNIPCGFGQQRVYLCFFFQYKDGPSRYGDSLYKDKTVLSLYENRHTGKTTFLYWEDSHVPWAPKVCIVIMAWRQQVIAPGSVLTIPACFLHGGLVPLTSQQPLAMSRDLTVISICASFISGDRESGTYVNGKCLQIVYVAQFHYSDVTTVTRVSVLEYQIASNSTTWSTACSGWQPT